MERPIRMSRPYRLFCFVTYFPNGEKAVFSKQIQNRAHMLSLVTVTQLRSWSPEILLTINSTFVEARAQNHDICIASINPLFWKSLEDWRVTSSRHRKHSLLIHLQLIKQAKITVFKQNSYQRIVFSLNMGTNLLLVKGIIATVEDWSPSNGNDISGGILQHALCKREENEKVCLSGPVWAVFQ